MGIYYGDPNTPIDLGKVQRQNEANINDIQRGRQNPTKTPVLSNRTPSAHGVGHPGVSSEVSRQDHVHSGVGGNGEIWVGLTGILIMGIEPPAGGIIGGGVNQSGLNVEEMPISWASGPAPAPGQEISFVNGGIVAWAEFPPELPGNTAWSSIITVNGEYTNETGVSVALRIYYMGDYYHEHFNLPPSGPSISSFSFTKFIALPGGAPISFRGALAPVITPWV